jgi:hypothetical protein
VTATAVLGSIVAATSGGLLAATGDSGVDVLKVVSPILGTGLVGVMFLMVIFRIKIMPTYVYDEAKKEWERERIRLEEENSDLKQSNQALRTMTEGQIIPALVRSNQLSADYAADLAAERRARLGHSE